MTIENNIKIVSFQQLMTNDLMSASSDLPALSQDKIAQFGQKYRREKKLQRYIIVPATLIGCMGVVSLGLFFSGSLLAIWPVHFLNGFRTPGTVVAGIAGGATEGQVMWNDVRKQIKIFFIKGPLNYLNHQFAKQHLVKLKAYQEIQDALQEVKAGLNAYNATKDQIEKLEQKKIELKAYLAEMETIFAKGLLRNVSNEDDDFTQDFKKLLNEQFTKEYSHLAASLARKRKMIAAVPLISFGAAVVMGIGSYSYILAGLKALFSFFSFSVVLSPAAIVLAVVLGFIYFFQMTRQLSECIEEETFKKIYHEIRDIFNEAYSQKNKAKLAALIVASVILLPVVILIAVIVPLLEFFFFKKNDVTFLVRFLNKTPVVLEKIAKGVLYAFSVMNCFAELYFSVANSLKSTNKVLAKIIKKNKQYYKSQFRQTWEKENILQFINPFRFVYQILAITAKTILFLLHVATESLIVGLGLMASPILTRVKEKHRGIIGVVIGVINNFFTDMHFIFNSGDQTQGQGHANIADIILLPITLPLKLLALTWCVLLGKLYKPKGVTKTERVDTWAKGLEHEFPKGDNSAPAKVVNFFRALYEQRSQSPTDTDTDTDTKPPKYCWQAIKNKFFSTQAVCLEDEAPALAPAPAPAPAPCPL